MAVIVPFRLTYVFFDDRAGLHLGLSSRYQCIKCITSPCWNNRSNRWAPMSLAQIKFLLTFQWCQAHNKPNRMPWRMPVSTKSPYAWWSLPALVWLDVAGGAASCKRRVALPAAVLKKRWKQTSQYITHHMCVWMFYSNLLGKQIATPTGGEFLPIAPCSVCYSIF